MNDWHLVNLFVPTLLPLFILGVLFLFNLSKAVKARANPLVAIKDGQLSWAGLGMCVNALYELRHPLPGTVLPELWSSNIFWLTLFVLLFHALFAALGPVFPTKPSSSRSWWKSLLHYRVLAASTILTALAGWLYSEIHLTTQTING